MLLLLAALPTPARATGIEDPTRWLGVGSTLVLDAPEFFFEFETARIAADLHPEFKAVVPEGIGSDRDYAKQTDTVDAGDFEDALKTGAVAPPDPVQAREAHLAAIKSLGRTNRELDIDSSESNAGNPDAELPSDASPTASPPLAATPSAAATATVAPAMPDEFPSEFADYHRGARAYHIGDVEAMKSAWTALLQRPPAERQYRTVWAEYMLGKSALEEKQLDEARTHFRAAREAVKSGARDTLGLAAASIGWEAKLEFDAKHYPEAARLYLEQRGTGDPTAVNSLHRLMNQIAAEVTDLTPLMNDPLLQRLATAAALTGIGDFGQAQSAKDGSTSGTSWLTLLESADAKQVKDADCVAWMEYQKGDYKAAERWLKVADADSPYTLWLKSKLALRDGKLEGATQLLSRAVPRLPEAHVLESRTMSYEMTPGDTSKGELGALRVGRADFIAAANLLIQVQKSDDAEYLAEAVLTVPEPAVPPVTEKERARLKQNIGTTLHRSHSIYVAADLGWRAAALMPDDDDHTAEVLNTAGSWLKNRDEKAADRFYQAIERRCSKTALGREAIKRHWFVPIPSSTTDE